jgi:hypothetical protein
MVGYLVGILLCHGRTDSRFARVGILTYACAKVTWHPGPILAEAHIMMKQMNIVATVCLGGIALAFCFATNFYPFFATLAFLGILGFVAFGGDGKKKAPPSEPWYMK